MDRRMDRGHRQRVDAGLPKAGLFPIRPVGADVNAVVRAGRDQRERETEDANIAAFKTGHVGPLRAAVFADHCARPTAAGHDEPGRERAEGNGGDRHMALVHGCPGHSPIG